MAAGLLKGYKRLSVADFSPNALKIKKKHALQAYPLSRQSVSAIPSKRIRYPVKAYPLSRQSVSAIPSKRIRYPVNFGGLGRRVLAIFLARCNVWLGVWLIVALMVLIPAS